MSSLAPPGSITFRRRGPADGRRLNAVDSQFPVWLYFAVFFAGLTASAASHRFWTRRAPAWALLDRPGPRKIHSRPTPLIGGLMIATGFVAPLLIVILLINFSLLGDSITATITYGLKHRALQLTALVCGAVGMLLLGAIDDRRPLGAGVKFSVQSLIAVLVTLTGTRVTLFIDIPVIGYLLTVLWILTLVNAFNFTDNMNGLCAGLAIVSALAFGLHAALPQHFLVASLCFLAAGSLSGFLPFNFPKGQTFLGDSGSYLTGYLIAVLAVLPHFYHQSGQHRLAVLAPLLVTGVVLLDLGWIVLHRWRRGKPLHVGDTSHLSHQLVRRGLGESQAVAWLWLLHVLLAAGSFLLT